MDNLFHTDSQFHSARTFFFSDDHYWPAISVLVLHSAIINIGHSRKYIGFAFSTAILYLSFVLC
uniref:Uncharacterized protein n=1 Tax=Arundo donax TaxID=35708 RepID=A0A0A9GHT9_ARUDO